MSTPKYREQITLYLGHQFDLPREQIATMMPNFMQTLSSHMDKLEEVLLENDLRNLAKASHTIKGALFNLGLTECAKIALQIENNSSNSDKSIDYNQLVQSLRLKVDEIVNE